MTPGAGKFRQRRAALARLSFNKPCSAAEAWAVAIRFLP